MVVGQQKTVDASGIVQVSVADPAVVKATQVEGGRLLITAAGMGESQILMWDGQGNESAIFVVVAKSDPEKLLGAIRLLLAQVEGVEVIQVGDRVVLDGMALTEADQTRVNAIAEGFAGVLNLVQYDPATASSVKAEEIRSQIDIPGMNVSFLDDTVILTGTVFDEQTRTLAGEVMAPFAKNVVNCLKVDDRMVEIDVHFLQLDTRKASDYGVNLPQQIQFGFNLGFDGSSNHGDNRNRAWSVDRAWTGFREAPTERMQSQSWGRYNNFSEALTYGFSVQIPNKNYLNWVLSKDIGKVIAKPHLTTHNGKEATFQAGGSSYFAIPGAGDGSGSLEEIEWGTILSILPVIHDDDHVECKITVEVSAPTAPNFGESYSVSRFETEGVVKSRLGETVVVAGLLQEVLSRFRDETPLLGRIPILNLFFSHVGKDKQDKDLLVLVTPYAATKEDAETPSLGSDYKEHRESMTQAR